MGGRKLTNLVKERAIGYGHKAALVETILQR